MRARIFSIALVAMCLAPCRAAAQSTWTEARVLERVEAGAPSVLAARVAAARARARVEGEGLYPNPSLDWERQESFEPNAQSQDVVRATIPVDLSGRRDAARLLAELGAEASEADARSARLDAASVALVHLYRSLALERRALIMREAQEGLDEAGRVLVSRQSAGEASGYERARLALEIELARSRLSQAHSQAQLEVRTLGVILGVEEAIRVEGDFDVAPPAPLARLVARAEAARPELSSLQVQRALASRARAAADLAWLPRFELFGGYNLQSGLAQGHGYAVGLRLELPFFDRGQGEQAEAESAAATLEAYAESMRAAVRTEVAASRARLESALSECARFTAASEESLALLLRSVESGYRGGERTLVELLDARRAALEVAEQRVALDLATRLADVELRRSSGDL